MSVRVRRIFAITALTACTAPLVFVSLGRAGSSDGSLTVSVSPSRVSAGANGFVLATFTAPSGSGTGTAVHAVLTLDLPPEFTAAQGDGCSARDADDSSKGGSSGSNNNREHEGSNQLTCNLGNVHKGETVKRFITFTTSGSIIQPTTLEVSGTVRFDNSKKSRGNGHGDKVSADTTATAYAADDPNHQGKCVSLSGDSTATVGVTATASNVKGTSAVFGSADPSLDLPCTPAAGGVDTDITLPGFTPGIWFVSLPQLGSSGVGRVTLTFYQLPWGKDWKTFQVFELPGYPDDLTVSPNPVQPCAWGGTLPSGQTSCVDSRSKFGYGGVKLRLVVKGSGVDPGYGG
jgi:hypothetical protein